MLNVEIKIGKRVSKHKYENKDKLSNQRNGYHEKVSY